MLYYRVQPIDIDEESGCLLSLLTVWQYTLMDSMQIQAGIEIIERLALASMPALNESEKACLRAVQEACEQVLKRTQPELRGNLNSEKLLDAVSALEPAQFFEWFDGQMPFRARDEMRTVIKAWVENQAGKHDFSNLSKEDAVREKHLIARGVQERLDEVGLKILCKHVGRGSEVECGKVGRLNAELTGSSTSGQYLIAHNSLTGGKGNHMRSKSFPALTIIPSENPLS